MRRYSSLCLVLALLLILAAGCSSPSTEKKSGPSAAVPATNSGASVNKNDYPVFPDADAGADPAVPAEQGGKGFTGKGWETNTDFDLIGDPHAVKGGILRDWTIDFPGTLRMAGPEWNTTVNYEINGMVYEG